MVIFCKTKTFSAAINQDRTFGFLSLAETPMRVLKSSCSGT